MKPGLMLRMLSFTSLAGMTVMGGLAFAAVAKVPATPKPTVKVDVFAQHSGSKIVYHYRVFNKSQQIISGVTIGLNTGNDENPGNDIYELYEIPSGWNSKFGIPSTSSSSPTGWRVSLSVPEKNSTHAINWVPLNSNTPNLLAGQILTKMSIAVDQPDTNYLTGHARLTFAQGSPSSLTVPLESIDRTPPEFTVTLNPDRIQSPNNKPIAILVSFIVKDDHDRKPNIKLESVTANQPLQPEDISDASFGMDDRYILLRTADKGDFDRIYTLTYSATDASGNQTFASGTVTVPHSRTTFLGY